MRLKTASFNLFPRRYRSIRSFHYGTFRQLWPILRRFLVSRAFLPGKGLASTCGARRTLLLLNIGQRLVNLGFLRFGAPLCQPPEGCETECMICWPIIIVCVCSCASVPLVAQTNA